MQYPKNLKQIRKIKHLQTQHDAVMTKLYTSLKRKEDFVALMKKSEEYKSKGYY